MSDKVQSVPLSGPMKYDFGDSTPDGWPHSYVAAEEYDELARRIDTMERDRRTAESENETLRVRVKALTSERDDYILKQKVWERANHELRTADIKLRKGLTNIVRHGDYTAPEGMKRIAQDALLASASGKGGDQTNG